MTFKPLHLQPDWGIVWMRNFSFSLIQPYTTTKQTRQEQAWQLPAIDADLNMRFTVAKKLNMRVQLYAIGERFQRDMFTESKPVETLSPFLDVNVMADYRYKKNISFFLNVNNISNSRYQKWYAYPSFGLNLLAGITFSL